MSDGDSNDKENSSTTLSSSSSASPQHLVPDDDNNDKLSSSSVISKEAAVAMVASDGDGDSPPPTTKDSPAADLDPSAASSVGVVSAAAPLGDPIDVKVVWNKNKYDVVVRPEETVLDLKTKMEELTQLPPAMQKIMFKGLCKDDRTMKVKRGRSQVLTFVSIVRLKDS